MHLRYLKSENRRRGLGRRLLGASVSRTEKARCVDCADVRSRDAGIRGGVGRKLPLRKSVVSRVPQSRAVPVARARRDVFAPTPGVGEEGGQVWLAIGYLTEGTRVLLHVGPGNRESHDNWKSFLLEIVARGLNGSASHQNGREPGGSRIAPRKKLQAWRARKAKRASHRFPTAMKIA